MNAKLVNAVANVICRSMENGRKTPTGWAMDLESAQLLQSPETVAEVERLRARVDEVERAYTFDTAELKRRIAELEAERHVTNEALSDAAVQLRANADRIAELEALKPAPIQTCRKCGAGYTYGEPCSTCAFKARMAAEVDGITVRIAPTQALSLEDPHDSPLAHTYLLGRDLPETGGAR